MGGHLVCASMAYFHDVLTSDGDPHTVTAATLQAGDHAEMALHEAIYHMNLSKEEQNFRVCTAHDFDTMDPPTSEQINRVARLLAEVCPAEWQHKVYVGQSGVRTETGHEGGGNGDFRDVYHDTIEFYHSHFRALLSSPHLHHLNLHTHTSVADKLLGDLINLNRGPKDNTPQGLKLLKEAWCEHDVAMYLADCYKILAKFEYLLQLIIGVAIIAFGVGALTDEDARCGDNPRDETAEHGIFGLSLVATLLVGLGARFNANGRWRQLRAAACDLESSIYLYRARVGPYRVGGHEGHGKGCQHPNGEFVTADDLFCDELVRWRAGIVTGAGNLQISGAKKAFTSYPPSIFRHCQFPDKEFQRKVAIAKAKAKAWERAKKDKEAWETHNESDKEDRLNADSDSEDNRKRGGATKRASHVHRGHKYNRNSVHHGEDTHGVSNTHAARAHPHGSRHRRSLAFNPTVPRGYTRSPTTIGKVATSQEQGRERPATDLEQHHRDTVAQWQGVGKGMLSGYTVLKVGAEGILHKNSLTEQLVKDTGFVTGAVVEMEHRAHDRMLKRENARKNARKAARECKDDRWKNPPKSKGISWCGWVGGNRVGADSTDADNFHSPLKPEEYANQRLRPKIAFWRRRIPSYARRGNALHILLILAGVFCSIAAYIGFIKSAVIASAIATALTSWVEFGDVSRKTERYTRAVVQLENLISHWGRLTKVDRASTTWVEHLVTEGESIIAEERSGWFSTAEALAEAAAGPPGAVPFTTGTGMGASTYPGSLGGAQPHSAHHTASTEQTANHHTGHGISRSHSFVPSVPAAV